jgi:hypothetical protein
LSTPHAEHRDGDDVSLVALWRQLTARPRGLYDPAAAEFDAGVLKDWTAMMSVGTHRGPRGYVETRETKTAGGGGWYVAWEDEHGAVGGQCSAVILMLVCVDGPGGQRSLQPMWNTDVSKPGHPSNPTTIPAVWLPAVAHYTKDQDVRRFVCGPSGKPGVVAVKDAATDARDGVLEHLETSFAEHSICFSAQWADAMKALDHETYTTGSDRARERVAKGAAATLAGAFPRLLDKATLEAQAPAFVRAETAAAQAPAFVRAAGRTSYDMIFERQRTFWVDVTAVDAIAEWKKAIGIVACLPVSSGENERSFSAVKPNTTRLRQNLSWNNLRNVLTVRYAGSSVDSLGAMIDFSKARPRLYRF